MSEYNNPRPLPNASASDPCTIVDNAISFDKVLNGDSTVTTYQGKELLSMQQAIDKFGFGVAPFTFAQGGILQSKKLLVSNEPTDGFLYKYVGIGSVPLTVTAGTNPTVGSDWQKFSFTSYHESVSREALRRTYAEAGLTLVGGSFEAGGTLASASDVLLHEASGKAYGWYGAFPKVVAAGSSVTGFTDQTSVIHSTKITAHNTSQIDVGNGKNLSDFISQLPSEFEQTGTAQALINQHNSDSQAHQALSAFITAEADRAEAAADAATVSAKVYANTSEGLAGTIEGAYFTVVSSQSAGYLDLYRKVSSAAAFIKQYPSTVKIPEIESDILALERNLEMFEFVGKQQDDYSLIDITDTDSRLIGRIYKDGLYAEQYESLSDISADIIDADGRILLENSSSNLTELESRVDKSLNDYGLTRSDSFGLWYLRETHKRSRKRLLGESDTLSVLMIGDSWTHNAPRYSQATAQTLKSVIGDAGIGYTGFAWGFGTLPNPAGINTNVDPSVATVSFVGGWNSSRYGNQTTPDICAVFSSTVGNSITVTTTKKANSGALFYVANGASIRYRVNADAWIALTLNGSGFADLTVNQAAGFTITFEVVSGEAVLSGVSFANSDSGAIVHKVGATGSQAAQWATQSATAAWKAGIVKLSPNLVTILHGTNDQATYNKVQFKQNMQTLITNIRSVLPLTDILLIAPCENGRNLPIKMSDYQDAMQELAYELKCGFINLQHHFGDTFSEYASTSPRNWFNADLIHPEPSTGGRAIADAVIKSILN